MRASHNGHNKKKEDTSVCDFKVSKIKSGPMSVSEKENMPFYGSIVVIRRSGVDGSIFPLVSSECLLGREEGCDIRVQLPTVSREHCRISVNQSEQVSQVDILKIVMQIDECKVWILKVFFLN